VFTLTPLAVALQGIGYGTLLTALQGLVAVTIAPELPVIGFQAPIRPRRHVRRVFPTWEPIAAPAVIAPAQPAEDLVELDDEEVLALLA